MIELKKILKTNKIQIGHLSIFRLLFKNNKFIVLSKIEQNRLEYFFDELVSKSRNCVLDTDNSNVVFFGKIDKYNSFKLNKYYVKTNFESMTIPFTKYKRKPLYSVKGQIVNNSILLRYNFTFENFDYFIMTLLPSLILLFASIRDKSFKIFLISVLFYISSDFLYNLILKYQIKKFHNDFIHHFPVLKGLY